MCFFFFLFYLFFLFVVFLFFCCLPVFCPFFRVWCVILFFFFFFFFFSFNVFSFLFLQFFIFTCFVSFSFIFLQFFNVLLFLAECFCFLLLFHVLHIFLFFVFDESFSSFLVFFLGLGVLALLSRGRGWPFPLLGSGWQFSEGEVPLPFPVWGLALPVGFALPSLG